MDDATKLAVKKFLYAVKNAVMAMDVNCLKDDEIASVYNSFSTMVETVNAASEEEDKEGE